MEPGHEDREYRSRRLAAGMPRHASMEPGHEDREYEVFTMIKTVSVVPQWSPVMKTGNTRFVSMVALHELFRLNGARS